MHCVQQQHRVGEECADKAPLTLRNMRVQKEFGLSETEMRRGHYSQGARHGRGHREKPLQISLGTKDFVGNAFQDFLSSHILPSAGTSEYYTS